ncbi:MAG: DUF4430 domain-containing protein [Clostridiales bacterium]|nr:DUF4430 domain-containing protein [Clostridiales bacterium]
MKKKTILIVLSTLLLALLVAGALWLSFATRAPVQEGGKQFTLTVSFPDEDERVLELATDADYLGAALLEKGLISGTESEFGLLVDTVDGLYADPALGQYWVFTQAGEWVMTGVDTTPVADGDSFEFFIYE